MVSLILQQLKEAEVLHCWCLKINECTETKCLGAFICTWRQSALSLKDDLRFLYSTFVKTYVELFERFYGWTFRGERNQIHYVTITNKRQTSTSQRKSKSTSSSLKDTVENWGLFIKCLICSLERFHWMEDWLSGFVRCLWEMLHPNKFHNARNLSVLIQ